MALNRLADIDKRGRGRKKHVLKLDDLDYERHGQ